LVWVAGIEPAGADGKEIFFYGSQRTRLNHVFTLIRIKKLHVFFIIKNAKTTSE